MKNAIEILHKAAYDIAHSGEPGSVMKLDTLHNAARYLLTGGINSRRGVANLWANLEVK